MKNYLELCQWIGQNKVTADPFAQTTRCEACNSVNYSAKYTDIMLFKNAAA